MKTVCTTVLYPNNRNTDMGGWGYNIAVLFLGGGAIIANAQIKLVSLIITGQAQTNKNTTCKRKRDFSYMCGVCIQASPTMPTQFGISSHDWGHTRYHFLPEANLPLA